MPARPPVEPPDDTATGATRSNPLQTVVRRVVLGAYVCIVIVIALLIGQAVLSATGLSRDPHGYAIFAGSLFAAVLTPVALALWLLHRSLRRRRK